MCANKKSSKRIHFFSDHEHVFMEKYENEYERTYIEFGNGCEHFLFLILTFQTLFCKSFKIDYVLFLIFIPVYCPTKLKRSIYENVNFEKNGFF